MTIYGRGPEIETPNRKPFFIGGVALVMALGLGAAYYACGGKGDAENPKSSSQRYEHQIDAPKEIVLRR
ncbi:MAG: hypothetical protein QT00_C0002G0205 [archaeon GW2011_AR5]|nr:MAG: hypothetical protein QT00_C0002G0205 [archaeon GW2011_AR5]